jgi:hypothetical protein
MWNPLEWSGSLLFAYSINPHEGIFQNPETGVCESFCKIEKSIDWDYGALRSGCPPQHVDGEDLAFFHSAIITLTSCSNNRAIRI